MIFSREKKIGIEFALAAACLGFGGSFIGVPCAVEMYEDKLVSAHEITTPFSSLVKYGDPSEPIFLMRDLDGRILDRNGNPISTKISKSAATRPAATNSQPVLSPKIP